MYRLYLNGKLMKTVKDKDGPGGRTAAAYEVPPARRQAPLVRAGLGLRR